MTPELDQTTILIVDDTPENLELLTAILTQAGYKVRATATGARGLVSAFKSPPDLILLDILMPELDGYEVCRRLKEDKRTHHIPVLFISALDEVFDKMRAFSSGGVDYITKPFQTEEVLARIETHLTIRRLQLELQEKNQGLQTANETLEEKVQVRTAELAQANDSLKAEIERRKRHQQEKDRLFKVVSQQSEQLRTMTTWLIQAGQTERQGLASELRAEIAQKVEVLQANLTAAGQMLKVGNIQTAAEHLASITQILAQVERYVTQVTTDLPQPTVQEQDLSENPLIKLTSREREVLQMLAQGKSSSEIAAILDITASSVHTYNHRIKDKLGLHDIPSLTKFALEHSLVE